MSNSIHTARWVSQIADQGWDLHLFPSIDVGQVHPLLKNITVYHSFFGKQNNIQPTVRIKGFPVLSERLAFALRLFAKELMPKYRIRQLRRLIKKLKPDLIHTMETQHAGYLLIDAIKGTLINLPTWVHSIWGSDLYLFSRLDGHQEKIKQVLSMCNYIACEGQRDIKLAKELGFNGKFLPTMQATSGFDIDRCKKIKGFGPVAKRKIIALKGYQGWAGRALVGLRALEKCKDLLSGYKLVIFSTFPDSDVSISAELFNHSSGIPIEILSPDTKHEEILKILGQSRFSIGLSISDGVPNSLLESMAMGCFPIQSWTSCADEWIKDGETGILVPPDDPEIVAMAIKRALKDDKLVNLAAEKNLSIIKNILDKNNVTKKVINTYHSILKY